MASLDVKTAFDVAKPSVVSKIFLISTHCHVVAASPKEMQDAQGSVEFGYPLCIWRSGSTSVELGYGTSRNHCGGRVRTRRRTSSPFRWEGEGKDWELPFREVFEVLGYHFQLDGKGTQGIEKTLGKGMGRTLMFVFRSVSLKTNCQRVISIVSSIGSANGIWNVFERTCGASLGEKKSALNLHPQDATGPGVGSTQSLHCSCVTRQIEEIGSAIFVRML